MSSQGSSKTAPRCLIIPARFISLFSAWENLILSLLSVLTHINTHSLFAIQPLLLIGLSWCLCKLTPTGTATLRHPMSFAFAINQCLAALCQKCCRRRNISIGWTRFCAFSAPALILPTGKSANIFGHSSSSHTMCHSGFGPCSGFTDIVRKGLAAEFLMDKMLLRAIPGKSKLCFACLLYSATV